MRVLSLLCSVIFFFFLIVRFMSFQLYCSVGVEKEALSLLDVVLYELKFKNKWCTFQEITPIYVIK